MSIVGDAATLFDRFKGSVALFFIFILHGIIAFLGFDAFPLYETFSADTTLNWLLFIAIFVFCVLIIVLFSAIHKQREYGDSKTERNLFCWLHAYLYFAMIMYSNAKQGNQTALVFSALFFAGICALIKEIPCYSDFPCGISRKHKRELIISFLVLIIGGFVSGIIFFRSM